MIELSISMFILIIFLAILFGFFGLVLLAAKYM